MRLVPRPIVFVLHDVSDGDWFEQWIREVVARREVLPLEDVARSRSAGTCALTFDDGLRSVADVAHPVLERYNLPYTVFVCTEVVTGGPLPWFVRLGRLTEAIGFDRLRGEWDGVPGESSASEYELTVALKEAPLDVILDRLARLEAAHGVTQPSPESLFMDGPTVRRLAGEAVSFGSHTHRHPILSKLDAPSQRAEIETSCSELEKLTGVRPSHFAYPNGSPLDFDATTVAILRDSGFEYAFTTTQRHVTRRDGAFTLPRIGLEVTDGPWRRTLKQIAPWLSRNHAVERRIRARAAEYRHSGRSGE